MRVCFAMITAESNYFFLFFGPNGEKYSVEVEA